MEKKEAATMIETNETVLRANLMNRPQLTPTGKISHAKTRVYTQRYRKAWEQMPDFKGWLTGVPYQPTRAFCTYCRKNLHAHRLSLLKHTCTMKHQRCALMHQNEVNAKEAVAEQKIAEIEAELEDEPDDGEGDEGLDDEGDEVDDDDDDEDIEYIVERLDEDDDQDNECHVKEEEEDLDDEEEDDDEPVAKIPKFDEKENRCRDALAEAMAHVHGEYLDENGDPVNVELEMVVESVDPNAHEMQSVSILPDVPNDENQMTIEAIEHDANGSQSANENEYSAKIPKVAIPGSKSSVEGESSEPTSETETVVLRPPPRLIPAIRPIVSKTQSPSHPLSKLPPNSPITVATQMQNKTITLSSGGKTVTLTASAAGKYTTGNNQYVLSKNKGKIPSLVLADNRRVSGSDQSDNSPRASQTKTTQQLVQGTSSYAVPSSSSNSSTSPQSPKKHIILKGVKVPPTKKPCISSHVLDTSKGLPVGGLQVSLYKLMDGRWTFLNESTTTPDGRCADLVDSTKCSFTAGRYKIHYDVDKYFTLRRIETMYPFIEIVFDVKNPSEHYHIPVLLSPFGYTTYRGT